MSNGVPDIVALSSSVSLDGTKVTATFNLTGATVSTYNLSLTGADGSQIIFANAFTIENGGGPNLWVDLIGRTTVRIGKPSKVFISYGNSGNVDARGIPIWLRGIPKTAQCRVLSGEFAPPNAPAPYSLDFTKVPDLVDVGPYQVLLLIAPLIAAGETNTITLELTANDNNAFTLDASISRSEFFESLCTPSTISNPQLRSFPCTSARELTDEQYECVKGVAETIFKKAMPGSCILSLADTMVNGFPTGPGVINGIRFLSSVTGLLAACTRDAAIVAGLLPVAEAAEIVELVASAAEGAAAVQPCIPPPPSPPPPGQPSGPQGPKTVGPINGVGASDPNDKVGNQGSGAQRYITNEQTLNYTIYFENKPDATAPAQQVFVIDQLDPAKVDLSAVSLGPISFGDTVIIPPPNISNYLTFVDLRPTMNLTVQVQVTLDLTGALSWTFTSLDPDTGLAPDDPLAGFLPPNINPPQGEGTVSFSVTPKTGLPTGTQISNTANIIFDSNAAIPTPTLTNTIDNGTPGSHVAALAPVIRQTNFAVNWSGLDTNSGISDYTIFVSTDNGPFTAWLTNTALTTAIFSGDVEHTYSFYSRARNNAGNLENDRGVADTSTKVAFGSNGSAYTVSKIQGSLKFDTTGVATCAISGTIPNLDATFTPGGASVTLAVDDGQLGFVLDANGKAKTAAGTFILKTKRKDPTTKKPVFGGGPVTFQASVKTNTWATAWKSNGIVSSPKPKNSTIGIVAVVQIGTAVFSGTLDGVYKSSAKLGSFSAKQ